jgi:hypothetical protein
MKNRILALYLTLFFFLAPPLAWADVKISQLPTNASPAGGDELPTNQGGITKKITLTSIKGWLDNQFGLNSHINDATIHRSINDASTSTTALWSASKTSILFATKSDVGHVHSVADITSGTLSLARGGTGMNTINPSKLLYSYTSNALAELSLGTSLGITGATLSVQDNTSTQKMTFSKAGSTIGTRKQLNLIEGSGVTITAADSTGNDRVDVTIAASSTAYPTGYRGSAAPVYASAASFTQGFIRERDSTDTANLTLATSSTVSTGTLGACNGILQSANLTGTVSVTASSTTTTFSTSQTGVLQAGDVLCTAGGQCRRLTSVSGTSATPESNWTSTETGVTLKRGGKASNTHLLEYYLAQTGGTNTCPVLSTRNANAGDTLVDLPAGYSLYRQAPFAVRLDGSGNLLKFRVAEGWPFRPHILYYGIEMRLANGGLTLVNGGTATTFVTINGNTLFPPIAVVGDLAAGTPSTSGSMILRPTGESDNGQLGQANGLSRILLPLNGSQQFDYAVSASSGYVHAAGYVADVP